MAPSLGDAAPALAGGRYRLVDLLGEGGQASVYRAWDTRLEVWRAVKVLHPHGGRSMRERFEAEARTLARLKHPNLLVIHDVGEDGSRAYMVMQLAAESLGQRLEREGPMPAGAACRLMERIADALSVAHRGGIVHRDVKPSNILVDSEGTPLIADFGIARVVSEKRTQTGGILGTLMFMAPEQRADSASVDARADLYSLGATLYATLTGHEPAGPTEELSEVGLADLPDAVRPVLRCATARDPSARHPSADALRDELAAVGRLFSVTDRDRWIPPITRSEDAPAPMGELTWRAASYDGPRPTVIPPPNPTATTSTGSNARTVIGLSSGARRRRVPVLAAVAIAGVLVAVGVAAVLTVGLGSGIAGLWWWSRPPAAAPALTLRRLTTYPPEVELILGGVGPDGKAVIYSQGAVGVWRQPVDGTEPPTLLLPSPTDDAMAIGAALAMVQVPSGALEIRDLASGDSVPFTHDQMWLVISPDSDEVVWLTPDQTALFRAPIGSDRAVALYKAPEGRTIDGVAWAPDQKHLAVAVRDGFHHHLLVVDRDGTSSALVATRDAVDYALGRTNLVWPWPDTLVVAETTRKSGDVLSAIPVSGGEAQPIARFDGLVFGISAAGGTLVLQGVMTRNDSWLAAVGPGGTLTDLHPAWANEDVDRPVAWLSDGSIVYTSDRLHTVQLMRQRPGEPAPTRLATCEWFTTAGEDLVTPSGPRRLFRTTRPSDGTPFDCSAAPATAYRAACAADGSCIVGAPLGDSTEFARFGPGETEGVPVGRIPLSEEVQYALAPDGHTIAVSEINSTPSEDGSTPVWIGDGATWREVRVPKLLTQRVAWRTDAPGLWVTGQRGMEWVVASLRSDGSIENVTPIPQGWPSVPIPSPDGKTLAIEIQRYDSDLWVTALPATAPR